MTALKVQVVAWSGGGGSKVEGQRGSSTLLTAAGNGALAVVERRPSYLLFEPRQRIEEQQDRLKSTGVDIYDRQENKEVEIRTPELYDI